MNKVKTITIDELTNTIASCHPEANLDLVKKAYEFSKKAHEGQNRSSGESYINHPLRVAYILAKMKLDIQSVITALLHDTVEDTLVTLEDIEKDYGKDIAELVDGVTKLSKISFRTTEEKQAENFRKMIVAMARDIRVIIVKLADRMDNMRTLDHLNPQKQIRIAQETLDVYAPIANRLGIGWMKIELEDLCLRFLHPDVYYKLAQKVAQSKKEREKYIDEVCSIISEKLEEYSIKDEVFGRAKHFYSIFKKMDQRKVDFEQIYDLIAFRIVVDNITECYKALGVIHSIYKPIPGRFKDYIAMPKSNSYQSLHTTVIGPYGQRIEIQIRTHEMQDIAERGIAAHWKYKEGKFDGKSRDNIEWVHRLLEWQKDLKDPNEFLETVKLDLFEEDVFVFTPKGEVKQLSHAATPLDFAYAIHTDVGHRCIGAKVNGKIVPLKHKLKSGDTIEVLTATTQSPSKDWLKIVRSSKAKAKIRAFIKHQERERARDVGRSLLDKELKKYQVTLKKIEQTSKINEVIEHFNLKNKEELLTSVGYGRIMTDDIVKKIVSKEDYETYHNKATGQKESFLEKVFKSAKKRSESKNAIIVEGLDDVLIRFAKCCNPLPGDPIVGFITRGRGVTVHTSNCTKALDLEAERKIEVQWNTRTNKEINRVVKIRVLSLDEPGLLAKMSQIIGAHGVNIHYASARALKDKKAISIFDIEVSNLELLQKIMSLLESQKDVISVERTRS